MSLLVTIGNVTVPLCVLDLLWRCSLGRVTNQVRIFLTELTLLCQENTTDIWHGLASAHVCINWCWRQRPKIHWGCPIHLLRRAGSKEGRKNWATIEGIGRVGTPWDGGDSGVRVALSVRDTSFICDIILRIWRISLHHRCYSGIMICPTEKVHLAKHLLAFQLLRRANVYQSLLNFPKRRTSFKYYH